MWIATVVYQLASDRVTKSVTIATDRGGRQRTSTDDASQVRHAEALAARIVTWLRDEEADASLANRELQPL
jgi:hypothetical protein